MIPLNLPPFDIKLKKDAEGDILVHDFLRRKWLKLTPEEWVRQHFTHYLVEQKHYPAGLLANEVGININGNIRRCDTVLYDRQGMRPRVIVEYKAPYVNITQECFTKYLLTTACSAPTTSSFPTVCTTTAVS